jgi:hypothetical protein
MVDEIRGLGMLSGIAFRAPNSLRLGLSFESFRRVDPAMFGQVIVMRMFREQRILTQMCGNNFMVVKAAPPLIIGIEQIERFVSAIREVVHQAHHSIEFWAEALGLARRALNLSCARGQTTRQRKSHVICSHRFITDEQRSNQSHWSYPCASVAGHFSCSILTFS